MASVTGQCPSQPEMHENRAEYVTGRLYLVMAQTEGRARSRPSATPLRPPRAPGAAARVTGRSRGLLPPFAGFLKSAAFVTVAEDGVSTAGVWRHTALARRVRSRRDRLRRGGAPGTKVSVKAGPSPRSQPCAAIRPSQGSRQRVGGSPSAGARPHRT